jgi:hypothetical protein
MSQSDYIQYKKTKQVLKDQTKLSKILDTKGYTMFETYKIATTVPNTKLRYSRLIPYSTTSIFNMDVQINNCPTFILCNNTDGRPNRVLNTTSLPIPTYKLNKINDPNTCTFHPTNNTTRICSCSKTICKCGTTICENNM